MLNKEEVIMRNKAVIVLLVLAIATIFAGCVSTPQSQPQLKNNNWPEITLDNRSPSGTSTPTANQLVARFSITNPGPREISIEKLQINMAATKDDIKRITQNGAPRVFWKNALLATGINWTNINAITPRVLTSDIAFATPLTITPGQNVVLDVRVDTSMLQAGDTILFVLNTMNWVVDLQSETAKKQYGTFTVFSYKLEY